MATLEQVEKLREKAHVSYDEAKAALDAVNGDLLEAMIYLEKQGKIPVPEGGGCYSSETKTADAKESAGSAGADAGVSGRKKEGNSGETFGELVKRFLKFCCRVIHRGNINTFEVVKDGECKASFPITVLVLLLIFAFWVTLPLLIVGLFFGLRYRFCGPDFGKNSVNHVMDKAAETADEIKKSVMDNHQ